MNWIIKVRTLSTGNNNYLKKFGLEILGKIRKMRKFQLKTHEEIGKAINIRAHTSVLICSKYKWKPRHIKRKNAQGWSIGQRGTKSVQKKNIEDIVKTRSLKMALINRKIKLPICEQCNWDYTKHPWWENIENKENCPLELHHKDGNKKNNSLDNIQLLCPNCHSLTKNYRHRNKFRGESLVDSRCLINTCPQKGSIPSAPTIIKES